MISFTDIVLICFTYIQTKIDNNIKMNRPLFQYVDSAVQQSSCTNSMLITVQIHLWAKKIYKLPFRHGELTVYV